MIHQCNCTSCRPPKQPDRSPPCHQEWPHDDKCDPCHPVCPPACPPPCTPPCPPPHHPKCPPKDRCHKEPECTQLLLPKIICSGREWQRRLCTSLVVNGLPDCARPPYKLCSVQQSGAQPWWEPAKCASPHGQAVYHVFIPVNAFVVDSAGCEYCCPAVVEMDACLQLRCAISECWHYCLFIVPCVRLACGPVCSNTECFEAELEVILELYLIQWLPFPCKPRKPECRELPLYPQPCSHPYTS